MSDSVVRYSISASNDSGIIAEVLHTKLLRKRKYVLAFDEFAGELDYAQNRPEKSRLTLEIGAQSVTCRDRRLSTKMQHRIGNQARELVQKTAAPAIVQFSSRQISAKAFRGFAVEGTLTVGDMSRPLKMNANFVTPDVDHLEIEGDFMFRFSEFDIRTPSSLFGMNKIGDQVLVQFHVHAVRLPSIL